MLAIKRPSILAKKLGVTLEELKRVAESVESYCHRLEVSDPRKPGRPRSVIDIRGPFRKIQRRLHNELFLPCLQPSPSSYGGVPGRSIKDNASAHAKSIFAFTCDIADFYPSIHSRRVYRFFSQVQDCSPDVARLLTRLCTYQYHLALGLVTSPLLADQLLKKADVRISSAAHAAGIIYTRYVDDITLSADFDLKKSGFPDVLRDILGSEGFRTNPTKDNDGRLAESRVLLTKLRVRRDGKLDVSREYYAGVCKSIEDHQSLGLGGPFEGPFLTASQLYGRAQFVCWVNPGRKKYLLSKMGSIPWEPVRTEATRRGLVPQKRRFLPVGRPQDVLAHGT